ncbi:MAG: heme o synthase [Bacteroidota bacterium]
MTAANPLLAKLSDYAQLIKLRLSLTVVFSAAMAYVIARPFDIEALPFITLILGGFCITASANAINCIIECDYDALMKRTATRPLPAGRMAKREAVVFAAIMAGLGTFFLTVPQINYWPGVAALVSLILYAFVYTPAKRLSPIAVFVGAFPGALPLIIGVLSATGEIGTIGWVLFGVQFVWQFPHFWAIGLLSQEDYHNAGFRLVPVHSSMRPTAINIVLFQIGLALLSYLPLHLGMLPMAALWPAVVANAIFILSGILLLAKPNRRGAVLVLLASILYLPILYFGYFLTQF